MCEFRHETSTRFRDHLDFWGELLRACLSLVSSREGSSINTFCLFSPNLNGLRAAVIQGIDGTVSQDSKCQIHCTSTHLWGDSDGIPPHTAEHLLKGLLKEEIKPGKRGAANAERPGYETPTSQPTAIRTRMHERHACHAWRMAAPTAAAA